MDKEATVKKTAGMLAGLGFRLTEADNDKYEIRNQANKVVASGDLKTIYWCAVYMSGDAKKDPEKYESMNKADQLSRDERIQAGREMARSIREGR
ncbi:MAG: hypothetical protein IKO25_00305 [Clostridia bacterium]|nr:hypothetical protein [Clostridia bacterium]